MNIFFTADPHYGHGNIIRYENRPMLQTGDLDAKGKWVSKEIESLRTKEMDELIINNTNSRVKEDDMLIIIGDYCFSHSTEASEAPKKAFLYYRSRLKCKNIIFLRGNHDKNHSNNWFISAGYTAVFEKVQVSGVIFSHFPAVLNKEEIERGIINVHGHFHNNPSIKWEEALKERITDNHYLLSLEGTNYTPVSLELIRKRKFVKNSKELIKNENKKD